MSKWPSDPSERAKALHAAGKLGGVKYGRMGGRPTRPTSANEAVARAANDNADEIAAIIAEQLRKGGSTAKLRAAQMLLQAERDEEKAERERFEDLNRDQLIELIAKSLMGRGALSSTAARDHLAGELLARGVAVEGTATELPSGDN